MSGPDRLAFTVHGFAATQGSKRHVGNGIMVESSKALRPWRAVVTDAAIQAAASSGWQMAEGAVSLAIIFWFRRPKAHLGRHGVKASAPLWHSNAPDADKLERAILDSLTAAGIYRDDGQVAHLAARKLYTTGAPRVEIRVRLVNELFGEIEVEP